MNRLKTVTRSIGTFALVAIFAVGFTALAPGDVEAGPCFCSFPVYSVMGWAGGGSTCAAAEAKCYNNALGKANQHCYNLELTSVCAVVSFTAERNHCPESSSPFSTDCDMDFRCYACAF